MDTKELKANQKYKKVIEKVKKTEEKLFELREKKRGYYAPYFQLVRLIHQSLILQEEVELSTNQKLPKLQMTLNIAKC